MKKFIITVEEARIMDEDTCREKHLNPFDLVCQAGEKLALYFQEKIKLKKHEIITIIAGIGNNGCDSLVMGLNLLKAGYSVSFIILGKEKEIKLEAWSIINHLQNNNAQVLIVDREDKLHHFEKAIKTSNYLVDGIFGTGLNRSVEGIYKKVISTMNASSLPIFSIDIPSGINGNTGKVENIAIHAKDTAIIQNYKVGNLLNDALDFHGKSFIIDIGLLDNSIGKSRYLLDVESLPCLPPRLNNSHKYHYGNILTIGGNQGMIGASIMSSYSALRTGSGLVTIALPKSLPITLPYPEIILGYYQDINDFKLLLKKRSIVIFGPGLGKENALNYEILEILLTSQIPLLVDADGLFYLKKFLTKEEFLSQVIITPHLGEFAQLLDKDIDSIANINVLENLAKQYKLTIVLKGPCTLIANEKEICFSASGNPGLATAGSGDVLSGIIASLIGQGFDLMDAAKLGVYLHSQAGNLAALKYGQDSLIATDISNYLPEALKQYQQKTS